MQKTLSTCAVAALAAFGASAQAQAQDITARVISATPIVQQVQVPRTVCNNQPVMAPPPSTGAGALIGAIAGGILGSAIGAGTGQVAAAGLGVVAGAAVGDNLERRGPGYPQFAQACNTETLAENRTVGYNVTYEYGGSQQTVQMANDPGPTVRLQVAQSNPYSQSNVYSGQGQSAPLGTMSVPAVVAGATPVYPAYAPAYGAPVYPATYYPGYYPGYYAAPIALSLGFGYSNWGHGHRGHYGHRGHGHRGGYRR